MRYKKVFQGTVGKLIGKKDKIHLKHDAKPFHGKVYRIPHVYIPTVNNMVSMLLYIGVPNRYETDLEWNAKGVLIEEGVAVFVDIVDIIFGL